MEKVLIEKETEAQSLFAMEFEKFSDDKILRTLIISDAH